jgi:hypothetical protein
MRKSTRGVLSASALTAAVAVCGIAIAAQPKSNGIYVDQKKNVTIFLQGQKSINSFNAGCPSGAKPKYSFSYIWGIPVSKNGNFHADRQNAVNTPNGGTLAHTSRVTIKGKFVSAKEAKGTYQLHKGNCKLVTFDAKLQK